VVFHISLASPSHALLNLRFNYKGLLPIRWRSFVYIEWVCYYNPMEVKTCRKCKDTLQLDCFYKDVRNKDSLSYRCKKCDYKQHCIWLTENKDKQREYWRTYWDKKGRKRRTPANPERQKEKQRAWLKSQRILILEHYGGKPPSCACCGEVVFEFLTIDHINNDGQQHRREISREHITFYTYLIKNNFPTDPPLQVLCYNCNYGKRSRDVCPHKTQ